MRLLFVTCTAGLLAACSAARPTTEQPSPPGELDHHRLQLELDPSSGSVQGRDRWTTTWTDPIAFRLRPGFTVESLSCGEVDLGDRLEQDDEEPGSWLLRAPRSCASDEGRLELDLSFAGRLAEAPADTPSRHFVLRERPVGHLGEGGAFLGGGTSHPVTGAMARYDLDAVVPAGWSVSSQGRPVESALPAGAGRAAFAFRAEGPSSGLALAAGPYDVRSRQHGELTLSTYLLEDDPSRSDHLLDALASHVDRFVPLFGEFPHAKFDLVESLGPGSHGFPSFALMGRNSIRPGAHALHPGSLAHQVAHAWWGNHVQVDPRGGDWCEGLTTHVADHLALAATGTDAARDHRRKVSQRHAVHATPEADVAAPGLRSATDGKVALVFHQLRTTLGDDTFFAGLRETARRFDGRRAGWSDLHAVFADVAERPLDRFFEQWTDRPGLPRLSLVAISQQDDTLRGRVRQEGRPYELDVDLEVTLADGRSQRERLSLDGAETRFSVPVTGRIVAVELDPDWDLPRALDPAELPPSLARTLAAPRRGERLVVTWPTAPAKAPAARRERSTRLEKLARRAAEAHGGEALPDVAVAEADWNAASFLILGGPAEHRLARRIQDELLALGLDPTELGFRAGDRRWREPADSLLVTVPHPSRVGASVSAWMPNGDAALPHGRLVFDHPWETWVALRGPRALARGTDWPDRSRTRAVLGEPDAPAGPAARMLAQVHRLVRPELEGREAGTASGRRTAEELAEDFSAAGLAPWGARGFVQGFAFYAHDLPRPAKLFVERPGRRSLAITFFPAPYWLPIPSTFLDVPGDVVLEQPALSDAYLVSLPGGVVRGGSVEQPALQGLDLSGAALVLTDDEPFPSPDDPRRPEAEARRRARYEALLPDVRRREGATLIIALPRAEPPFLATVATYASLSSETDPALRRAVELGGLHAARREAAARHARVRAPQNPVRLAFAGTELLDALAEDGAEGPGQRAWADTYADLRMRAITARLHERNVIGMTTAARPLRDGVVLVTAHHDGLGVREDGTFLQGALDGAAGVAVLLEVARRLASEPPEWTVAFASLGGEEWGQRGAAELLAAWPSQWPLRAVVDVGAVGQAQAKLSVHGAARAPALAGAVLAAARARGLGDATAEPGAKDGGKLWRFVEQGIPAVTLRQCDESAPGTTADTVEQVDGAALVTLADVLEESVVGLANSGAGLDAGP